MTVIVFTLVTCKRDKASKQDDENLYNETASASGFIFYKDDPTVQTSSPQSAHNPFFRVRFNQTAYAALTDSGRLPIGGSFPEGSIVVKELYDSQSGSLALLAVMKKTSSSYSANGWEWAEYEPGGDVKYSLSEKGSGCTGCHGTDARDNVRLFNIFP